MAYTGLSSDPIGGASARRHVLKSRGRLKYLRHPRPVLMSASSRRVAEAEPVQFTTKSAEMEEASEWIEETDWYLTSVDTSSAWLRTNLSCDLRISGQSTMGACNSDERSEEQETIEG